MHIDIRNLMSDFVNYKSVKIVPNLINYNTIVRTQFLI